MASSVPPEEATAPRPPRIPPLAFSLRQQRIQVLLAAVLMVPALMLSVVHASAALLDMAQSWSMLAMMGIAKLMEGVLDGIRADPGAAGSGAGTATPAPTPSSPADISSRQPDQEHSGDGEDLLGSSMTELGGLEGLDEPMSPGARGAAERVSDRFEGLGKRLESVAALAAGADDAGATQAVLGALVEAQRVVLEVWSALFHAERKVVILLFALDELPVGQRVRQCMRLLPFAWALLGAVHALAGPGAARWRAHAAAVLRDAACLALAALAACRAVAARHAAAAQATLRRAVAAARSAGAKGAGGGDGGLDLSLPVVGGEGAEAVVVAAAAAEQRRRRSGARRGDDGMDVRSALMRVWAAAEHAARAAVEGAARGGGEVVHGAQVATARVAALAEEAAQVPSQPLFSPAGDVAVKAASGLSFATACTCSTTLVVSTPLASLLGVASSLLAVVQVLACAVYMVQAVRRSSVKFFTENRNAIMSQVSALVLAQAVVRAAITRLEEFQADAMLSELQALTKQMPSALGGNQPLVELLHQGSSAEGVGSGASLAWGKMAAWLGPWHAWVGPLQVLLAGWAVVQLMREERYAPADIGWLLLLVLLTV